MRMRPPLGWCPLPSTSDALQSVADMLGGERWQLGVGNRDDSILSIVLFDPTFQAQMASQAIAVPFVRIVAPDSPVGGADAHGGLPARAQTLLGYRQVVVDTRRFGRQNLQAAGALSGRYQ